MHSRESGQALPLGIALLLAGVLTGVVLFNTGEVVNEKTRLANAADAAVYSGMTWQARALNFNAYTNRAMVANQVAMAQAVSLQSWAAYARTTTGNLNTVFRPVPILGQIAEVVNRVMTTLEPLVSGLGTGILTVVDPINSALSVAQEAMYLSAFIASPQIIDSVAEANDPRITTDSAFSLAYRGNNFHDWSRFTDQFEKTDSVEMDERIAMINASTDSFTRDRSWDFFRRHLPVSPLYWFRVERSGSTRLLRDEETGDTEWKALDTVSLNSRFYYFFNRYEEVEVPVGYSMKFANDQEDSIENCTVWGANRCSDWFGRNRNGQRLARSFNRDLTGTSYEPKSSTAYRGVRAYRSLSNEIRRENVPSVLMRTELQLATDDINDANSINVATHTIDPIHNDVEATLSSVSSAEVFFNRPEDDVREEYASGYNPFWTVRLAPTTNTARTTAMTLRGSADTAFAVSANLAVFEGEGNYELPDDISSVEQLERWSPGSVGVTASSINATGDLMEEVLTNVLDDVFERILAGTLSSGLQSVANVQGAVLGGVNIDEINGTVDSLNADIDELTERYTQARQVILEEFMESVERLRLERDTRLAEINQAIAELEAERNVGAGEDRDEDIHREIQALQAERDGFGDQLGLDRLFRENLAREFMSIVNRVLPEWPISYREALFVVNEYLRHGSNVTDQINIIDLSESSGDDND